jgi:hypothetical protein
VLVLIIHSAAGVLHGAVIRVHPQRVGQAQRPLVQLLEGAKESAHALSSWLEVEVAPQLAEHTAAYISVLR